jgi:hypothetical protein
MATNKNKLQKYNEFAGRAKQLSPGDDDGLKELITAAVDARLSDTQVESLIAVAARTTKIKPTTAKRFAQKAQDALKRRDDATPAAKDAKKLSAEAAEKAAKLAKDVEIADLYASCKGIAESPTLLADLEAFVRQLGVIGEEASIRGTYIAGRADCHARRQSHICAAALRRQAKTTPSLKFSSCFPARAFS